MTFVQYINLLAEMLGIKAPGIEEVGLSKTKGADALADKDKWVIYVRYDIPTMEKAYGIARETHRLWQALHADSVSDEDADQFAASVMENRFGTKSE